MINPGILHEADGRRRVVAPHSPFVVRHCALFLSLLVSAHCEGATLAEDFATDPAQRGWRKFGDARLFHWNPDEGNLEVTWDSTRSNSYFYRSLENILAKSDDFALRFDLRLDSIQAGVNPDKPSTFEISAGFINLSAATNANFSRGTGRHSPHLVEFDYFPAADFIAATVSPAIVSSNSQFATSFTFPLEMTTGDWFQIEISYTGSNQTLVTTMTRNGVPFGPIQDVKLTASFTDFRVDAVAVSSYNDAGDAFGSVLARGVIDNVLVTLPPPPASDLAVSLSNGVAQIEFTGRTNWIYTLDRTADFEAWTSLPAARPGIEGRLVLPDFNASAGTHWFYRVRAERP